MRLWVANPHGFCGGVKMAVQSLEKALELFGPPVYVYHEIIHNRTVVNRFRERGVVFVDTIGAVPEGGHLLFSAHGVSPQVREEARSRGLRAIDASCPLVNKVHREARRFSQDGYYLVLIGYRDHDEIVGTVGELSGPYSVVETVDDVARIRVPEGAPIAYLTQTTLSMDHCREIIAALRNRFHDIVNSQSGDICYATQLRQRAVKEHAPKVDIVLVVGSPNSSNSRRLAEIAGACGRPAYLIDGVEDIREEWFAGVQSVLLTAGASAPEDLLEACIDFLRSRFHAEVEHLKGGSDEALFKLPRELRE